MRIFIVAAAAAGLAGCTTIPEMQNRDATASYMSARSVPALAQCLATQLSYVDPPSVIPGESETLVVFGASGTTDAVFTLRAVGNQNAVEVRTKLNFDGRLRRKVEACVNGS